MTIQWNNLLPVWLILLLGGALLASLVYSALMMLSKKIPGKLIATLTGLRLAILGVFVLVLLQPAISTMSEVPQLPELIILVDTSRSMGQPSGTGSGTRLSDVTDDLQHGSLTDALKKRYGLHWFAFDSTASPGSERSLAGLKAEGESTKIADSITAACNHVRSIGKNPQRLLLVSDGNDRGDTDALAAARRFGLTVDVLAPKDSSNTESEAFVIADVQGAGRVLKESETHFRVTLRSQRPAAADLNLTVKVTESGKKLLEQPVLIKAGRTEETVILAHRPAADKIGMQLYEFHLVGGAESGKPYRLAVQVLDSKYEVLFLEDTWRWEYKYLYRLFEDDPSFRFTALLARGNGTFLLSGFPDRRIDFPQSRADLEPFDIFVIGDVDPNRWRRDLAAALARQIKDEGKSLVVIGGTNLPKLLQVPELHALLPVELSPDSGTPVDGPLKVRFRPESRNSPFFFQLRSPGGSDKADKLPPLDQVYPSVRKRPGATVLVETEDQKSPLGSSQIVIAEHTIGKGRVLYIGTDTLWKWHTLAANNEGPTPYSIFWQQAFRAMTPLRSNVGAVNLWLSPSSNRVEPGHKIRLQAEVQSKGPIPQPSIQAAVTLPDKSLVPLVFRADSANPKLYHADFTATIPGQHRIAAALANDDKPLAEAVTFVEVDGRRSEGDDQGIDHVRLARLAQATGGKIIDPAHPETWPAPSEGSLAMRQEFRTIDLWNNFTLLLLLCTLLATDWFIRLFKGLVSA